MAGFVGGLVAVETLLSHWGLLPGVDFWRIDPLGPGLPTSGAQVTRGREARAAVVARRDAADAVPLSRTPQEWESVRQARQDALAASQDVVTLSAADEAEQTLTERQRAHEDYRARLRAVKARG
jgi:hypothetical protein